MTTTASILIEENIQKGDFDIASKNMGSFVKINSISIDLADVNDKSYVGQCEHFSIRGYVSEVRKKNWKLCWPFAFDDEQNKSNEKISLLPPLTSPKFRYWSCECCMQEFGCTGTEKDHATTSNNCSIVSKSKSDCCQMPSPCSETMHLPDDQAPKTNFVEKRQYDVCTSTDVNSKNIHQEKKALLVAKAHTSLAGTENGSAKDAGHELPGVTSVSGEINLIAMHERPDYDTESRKLEETRPVESCKHSRGKHDVPDVVRAIPMDSCKNSTKICMAENPTSVDEQLNKLKIASGSSVLATPSDGATKSVKKNTSGCVSGLLDECDRASSDSGEIVGSNVQDHKSSFPSGPQRRKTRKVRLLTDLLFDSGDAKTEQVTKDVSPLSVVNSESTGRGMVSAPRGQKSFPDNSREDSDDNKKRKLPKDDEWRPPEINLNKKAKNVKESEGNEMNLNKKVKSFKESEGDEINLNKNVKNFKEIEGNDASALPDSEIKGDMSTGLNPQTNRKTDWSKYGSDKLPIADKKKNKKSQSTDVHSYLVPIGENFPKQGLDEVGISNKGNVQDGISFGAVNEAPTSRGMDKIPLAVPRMEKKPSLSNDKSKLPQLYDRQSPQCHWNNAGLLKNGPIMRHKQVVQTGSSSVPFRPAEDASIDTGLELSLGTSAAPKKCNRKYTPQVGDGIPPLPRQEGTPVDETVMKVVERNYISESTIQSKSSSYSFFKKRVHGDVNGQLVTYNVPVLNEKQNSNSQIEGRQCLGKQVDTSGTSNSQKTTKLRKHAVEIVDQVSDKGSADEIPMEIVELLASIQYEKVLQIPENNQSLLKAAAIEGRKTPMLEYDRVYNAEKFRTPEETSKRTNPQARHGKNGITTARKNVKPTRQKSVEHFPNVNGDHASSSHLVQKKSSPSIQLSASSPTYCSCAQNCQWNASMLGHGFFNASIQRGLCDTCPAVPRPTEEANQIWPTAIPLERPTRYSAPHRNNLQIASSPPGYQQKGDYMNREQELKYSKHYAANLEIPGQPMVSETFSRRNTEYQYVNKHNGIEHQQNLRGSLDLYTNETIPAMHLLSLVTAGMSSGPNFNTGGNTNFLEKECPDNNSKEYPPQMLIGVYNNKQKDVVKHPLEYHGKNQLSVKSHDFFPVNPMAGPSTSSFRHEKGFERANDFMGQVSFSSRGKEKVRKSSAPPAQIRSKPPSSGFPSGGYAPSLNAIPVHGIQKGFLGASSSMVPSLQPRTAEYPTELKLGTPHATGAFRPLKISPELMFCSVNRNPADFSFPGPRNEYMIRGEDLKVRKSRKKRGSTAADQRKPQKHAKRTAEKELAQHPSLHKGNSHQLL